MQGEHNTDDSDQPDPSPNSMPTYHGLVLFNVFLYHAYMYHTQNPKCVGIPRDASG